MAFNGKSYREFYEQIEKESYEQGRKWWGYVDTKGDRFNKAS